MADQEGHKDSFSLYELSQHLRRVVSFNMRDPVWIRCEIADVNYNRGMVYLSLIDQDEYRLRAKARGIIRPRTLDKIKKRIGDPLWSILQVGQSVLVQVQVEYSELYGISLSLQDIDTVYTIGQLELQRAATLKKLEAEHFTDLNRQLDLPLVPQRIAVISSKEAAGLQDFLEQLHNNPHHYAFQSELFQAAVQGVKVANEVVAQIDAIESQRGDFDCIIIVRGGGARLDLMGFDSFELCKAVATCELPVITGIGHDVDETLVDLVAHTALKTPTAVADFLVQRMLHFEARLQQNALDLQQIVMQRLQKEALRLDQLDQRLRFSAKQRLEKEKQHISSLAAKLELLSYENVLKRGFAMITDKDGKPIRSIEELEKGQELIVRLQDGSVNVLVVD